MSKISLRPLVRRDATRMLEWMNDDNTTKHLLIGGKKYTRTDADRFIEQAQDESINLHRAVVDERDLYLGTISLKNIDREKHQAEYAIAMHPDGQGTGAALLASKEMLLIAETLDIERLYLNVLQENTRAVKFYQKLSALGLKLFDRTSIIIEGKEKELLWFEVFIDTHKRD